jgi:nucleotide-binding universal stress UspA family protein
MITMKNILVATDFGHTAASALAYGRELARQYQGRLHVFHAVDDLQWRYSLDMSPGLLAGIQEDLEGSARQHDRACHG